MRNRSCRKRLNESTPLIGIPHGEVIEDVHRFVIICVKLVLIGHAMTLPVQQPERFSSVNNVIQKGTHQFVLSPSIFGISQPVPLTFKFDVTHLDARCVKGVSQSSALTDGYDRVIGAVHQ
jgi:hypothetical protein